MKNFKILLIIVCTSLISINAQSQDINSEVKAIIDRINKEAPLETGCTKKIFSYDNCTINCTLKCGGNEFIFTIKMNDIERVYKDKADLDDQFETLFFECKEGKNCITCNSEGIPPSPVFPVRLPEDKASTLGDDAVKVFSSVVESCR